MRIKKKDVSIMLDRHIMVQYSVAHGVSSQSYHSYHIVDFGANILLSIYNHSIDDLNNILDRCLELSIRNVSGLTGGYDVIKPVRYYPELFGDCQHNSTIIKLSKRVTKLQNGDLVEHSNNRFSPYFLLFTNSQY